MTKPRRSIAERASGLLLHPTSLPSSPYVGDLGPAARAFADSLHQAGQRWWQMLPIGPVGMGDSPYNALSAFAGNPILISFGEMVADGYLSPKDLPTFKEATSRVDFNEARRQKNACLRKAFNRFRPNSLFLQFCEREKEWLLPYARFIALKMRNYECSWIEWKNFSENDAFFENDVRFHQFVQFIFFEQWQRLRDHCARKGIGLIGDVPIYVAHDSADVWANPQLFYLDKKGRSTFVAGTPPDYFSQTGQLWGNPLYKWEIHQKTRYAWWSARLHHMLRLFDALRIDHFIAFSRYWKINARHSSAKNGRWVKGPGEHFFETVLTRDERRKVIAEDLGATGPDVETLRRSLGFPGMRVLQFSFEPVSLDSIGEDQVVYTGTHDNDTSKGWFENIPPALQKVVLRAVCGKKSTIHWDLIRTAQKSPGILAISPVQDVLGLGSDDRMNRPGSPSGNWNWRLNEGALKRTYLMKLRKMAKQYGRA